MNVSASQVKYDLGFWGAAAAPSAKSVKDNFMVKPDTSLIVLVAQWVRKIEETGVVLYSSQ